MARKKENRKRSVNIDGVSIETLKTLTIGEAKKLDREFRKLKGGIK